MPQQTINIYALTLLVHSNGGRFEASEPGIVKCFRAGTAYPRTYDLKLPERLLRLARANAIRRAVADAYPEFFSSQEGE